MNRAKISGAVLTMAALAAVGMATAKQPKKPALGKVHAERNEGLQVCAKACSDCQRACDLCSTLCAYKLREGQQEYSNTLLACLDCADICAATSQVLARSGPFSTISCEACADACAGCAKQCEEISDDAHLKACAKACRECEKSCRSVANHASHEN